MLPKNNYVRFELMRMQFTGATSKTFNMCTLYLQPSSAKIPRPMAKFYLEVEQLFRYVSIYVRPTCIVDDFYIRYDL